MTNKVLVAIDGTGLPEVVIESLSAQADPGKTEILVLQIMEPLLYATPPQMSARYQPETMARRMKLHEHAKDNLTHAVKILRDAGFTVHCRLVESEIKEGILNVASEWGANLIVVTSHARKGVAKFLHRSVAEGIIHRAPCSVLVLKETASKETALKQKGQKAAA